MIISIIVFIVVGNASLRQYYTLLVLNVYKQKTLGNYT